MNGTYLTVAGRIRRELQDLQRLAHRTLAIWQAGASSGNDYYIDAVALNLHGFYVGVERLLELIADSIDQAKPGGANWHQQLLRQMATDIVLIRPMVLRQETVSYLDKYRGFREKRLHLQSRPTTNCPTDRSTTGCDRPYHAGFAGIRPISGAVG